MAATNIIEIYKKYRINKGLQEHMIRVASVTKMICDNSTIVFNEKIIISACLLHDMGNIVKTKFDLNPELFDPEGTDFYKQVQKEVIEKYGTDDHEVTLSILSELQISTEITSILNATGMRKIPYVVHSGNFQEKIMMYSDLRVGMLGIISINERFDDLERRYVPHRYSREQIESGKQLLKDLELDIFSKIAIIPTDISDNSTKIIQKDLRNFELF